MFRKLTINPLINSKQFNVRNFNYTTTVLTEKKSNDISVLKNYSKELHAELINNNNFISAENYWHYEKHDFNNISMFIITKWRHPKDFYLWLGSKERHKISSFYKEYKIYENHKILKKVDFNYYVY